MLEYSEEMNRMNQNLMPGKSNMSCVGVRVLTGGLVQRTMARYPPNGKENFRHDLIRAAGQCKEWMSNTGACGDTECVPVRGPDAGPRTENESAEGAAASHPTPPAIWYEEQTTLVPRTEEEEKSTISAIHRAEEEDHVPSRPHTPFYTHLCTPGATEEVPVDGSGSMPNKDSCSCACAYEGCMTREEIAVLQEAWEAKANRMQQEAWALEAQLQIERRRAAGKQQDYLMMADALQHAEQEAQELRRVIERLLELPTRKELQSMRDHARELEEKARVDNASLKEREEAAEGRARQAEDEKTAMGRRLKKAEKDLKGLCFVQAQLMEDVCAKGHESEREVKALAERMLLDKSGEVNYVL